MKTITERGSKGEEYAGPNAIRLVLLWLLADRASSSGVGMPVLSYLSFFV